MPVSIDKRPKIGIAGTLLCLIVLLAGCGGSVSIAHDLANYIKHSITANSYLYADLRYSYKQQAYNFNYYFRPGANSLDLNEVPRAI